MAQPFVISGQAWGESNLIGRPAIFDLPQGAGHVVAFNFNPLHRDLNRGDQRMLWNAIINWRAILTPPASEPRSSGVLCLRDDFPHHCSASRAAHCRVSVWLRFTAAGAAEKARGADDRLRKRPLVGAAGLGS